MADLEQLRQRLEEIPFSHLIGLRVVAADEESLTMELPSSPRILNHVGTTHAAAQFALGEGVVGAMALVAFPDLIARGAAPVLAEASVAYKRPAAGALRARGVLPRAAQDRVRAEFLAHGRARYEAPVDLTNADGLVTTTLTVAMVLLVPR
jgi:acyl-coenzyme A thioesterase PaaI-like protein